MNGIAGIEPDKLTENLQPLFQEILKLPKAQVDANHPLQMLIANVDYDDFKGKMGIGRVLNGMLNAGDSIAYGKPGEPYKTAKIAELYVFNNVGREKVETASAGESVECYLSVTSCIIFYSHSRAFLLVSLSLLVSSTICY
jgi:GTP-binding protein